MNQRICSVEDCERSFCAKDLCRLHYERLRIRGTYGFTQRIKAVVGKTAELIVAGVAVAVMYPAMCLFFWWLMRLGYFGDGNTGAFD